MTSRGQPSSPEARRRKFHALVAVLFTPLLLAAACTTGRSHPGGTDAEPAPSPSSSSSSIPPPPVASPPRQAGQRACTQVGCDSGVTFIAHLDDSPAALGARGAFRMCEAADCWNGTFLAPSSPGGVGGCQITPAPYVPSYRPACMVREEGPGSRLEIKRAGGRVVDGERVSLRVVVGGRTVVDHERHVIYDRYVANGPECGPTCREATVEVWPGSRSGVTCSNAVCDAVVRFESTLPMTREGAGEGATLTACRNGVCNSSPASRLWHWDDASDAPVPESQGGAGVVRLEGATAEVSVRSGEGLRAPYQVKVEFRGDPRGYKNGDRYSIEWKSRDGQVLLSEERVVTAYDESHPGGPGCAPVTCRSKSL